MVRNNSENKKINPYISFVVAARNDNYGGNFLYRIQIFTNGLLELWKKYSLNAELIIVEWNPPLDAKKLSEVIVWPKCLKPGQVRFIEVPNEIHRKFLNSDKIPLFEYIAKNVGIRRAKGEYVLATNPDLLFNEDLIKFFSTKKLLSNCFYRVNRYDLEKMVPFDASVEEQLSFCQKNWVGICTIKGSFVRGHWLQNLRTLLLTLAFELKGRLIGDYRFKIYSAASGDFFLMANFQWQKLRGYPEFETQSFIDGYICFEAAGSGLSQIVLNNKKRVYHQEHKQAESLKRPLTDYQLYRQHAKQMMKENSPLIFNDENWGLGNIKLKEYRL